MTRAIARARCTQICNVRNKCRAVEVFSVRTYSVFVAFVYIKYLIQYLIHMRYLDTEKLTLRIAPLFCCIALALSLICICSLSKACIQKLNYFAKLITVAAIDPIRPCVRCRLVQERRKQALKGIWGQVEGVVRLMWPSSSVLPYGSWASGMMTPDSDLDLVVRLPTFRMLAPYIRLLMDCCFLIISCSQTCVVLHLCRNSCHFWYCNYKYTIQNFMTIGLYIDIRELCVNSKGFSEPVFCFRKTSD